SRIDIRNGCASALKKSALNSLSCCLIQTLYVPDFTQSFRNANMRICTFLHIIKRRDVLVKLLLNRPLSTLPDNQQGCYSPSIRYLISMFHKSKRLIAVFFLIFTFVAIGVGQHQGHKMPQQKATPAPAASPSPK